MAKFENNILQNTEKMALHANMAVMNMNAGAQVRDYTIQRSAKFLEFEIAGTLRIRWDESIGARRFLQQCP